MIGVKNNGTEALVARYDGTDFKFEPGVTQALSEDAATHIFGFGLEDKTRVLARLGWATNSAQYDDAVKRLESFQFLVVDGMKFKEGEKLPAAGNTLHLPNPQQAIKKP